MTPDREVQEGTCVLPDRSQPRSPGLEATSDNSDELNRPQLLQAHKIPIAGIRRHMKQEKGVSLISAETRGRGRARFHSSFIPFRPPKMYFAQKQKIFTTAETAAADMSCGAAGRCG